MTEDDGRICGNCRFWEENTSVGDGDCRRRAPAKVEWDVIGKEERASISRTSHDNRWRTFPITSLDDWCGEHEPLPPRTEPTRES